MEKVLKLYTYVNGVNDPPFPNADKQIEIHTFKYEANRMGGAASIEAKVLYETCLDNKWSDKVYALFNGEKYYVKNTPSSQKSNNDERYEHDLQLLSERDDLNHVYFIDAVQGDSSIDKPKSNSTKVNFMGDINEFVGRLNASMTYSGLTYKAVLDSGISSESKLVSFENKYILQALQDEFNIFEIPYYFVGKTIHFGYTDNTISDVFRYGAEDALLSIAKNNANYAIINRITGMGSEKNIPYYYPNASDDRKAIEASGGRWITPSQNLMPPIYRESFGEERFYEAKNNTYTSPEGLTYTFENEYSDKNRREGIVNFPNIEPTIVGMTNASGQRIDQFIEFAYDRDDDDSYDEAKNEYTHSYFFAKLRKTDGAGGFNLFDQANEKQTMQISMTNGVCGACVFEIGVGEETNKNIVQVDEQGNLKRDENGNVIRSGKPQDRQNNTQQYEVWIALKKDDTTFPNYKPMPNVTGNLRPSVNDTFVILGISLPDAYIKSAEKKLEDSLIKYMYLNNNEKFNFNVKFSRIFFAEHPDILATLNENSRIIIEYNKKEYTMYIDSYTYSMDEKYPLPEVDINLVDTLTIGRNSLQTALDSIKQDLFSSGGGGDFLKLGLKYFLRKDAPDVTKFLIKFLGGAEFGLFRDGVRGAKIDSEGNIKTNKVESHGFNTGVLGTGFQLKNDPDTHKSYLEVDNLFVRLKAFFTELEIRKLSYAGGNWVFSPGGAKCAKVVDMGDFYRCYFVAEDGETKVKNEFRVDDQVRCQEFNVEEGVNQNVSNRYYWRLCVGTGKDYIDLSKSDCDEFSDAPEVGDDMVVLGNRTDATRQNAIVISAYGEGSPSFTQHQGINSYSLANTEKTRISPQKNKFTGEFIFSTTQTNAEDEIKGAKQEAADAKAKADSSEQVANSAKERLNQWADDGYISPTEKIALKQELENLKAEKNEIVNDADRYSVATTNYITAFNEYTTELEYYINSTEDNTQVLPSFETTQTAYYTQRTDILNAIAYEAKQYVINLNDSTKRSLTTKIEAVDGRITSEVKSVKEYADGVLKDSKIYTDSQFEILDGKITSQVTRSEFDALGNRVSNNESTISQQATEIESKVSSTDFNGNTIVSKINQTATTATINAWHINLNGQVSFSSFDNSLKNDFNDKANSSDLGALAYLDSVNADIDQATMNKINGAMQEKTYINGGFLNTTYARVKTIEAVEGTIGGFEIKSQLMSAQYNGGAMTLSPEYLGFVKTDLEARIGSNVLPVASGVICPMYIRNSLDNGGYLGNGVGLTIEVGKSAYSTVPQIWLDCHHADGGQYDAYGWGSEFRVESRYFGDQYGQERTCINVGTLMGSNHLKAWNPNAKTFKTLVYNTETKYICFQV